jgi:hypothetical protein
MPLLFSGRKKIMQSKRKISGRDFIRDIRSGMGLLELMKKYRISSRGLRRIFRKIREADAMDEVEFASRPNLYVGVSDLRDLRRTTRKRMYDPVWLYDGGDPFKRGRLRDISDTGICIEGIEAHVGERKTFIVRLGPSGRNSSFVFEGECRWFRKEKQPKETIVAGFEIISITSMDRRVFQSLFRK